jgi:hypothetical protein
MWMDGQLAGENVADNNSASKWWDFDLMVDDESLVPFDEKENHPNRLVI